MDKFIPPLSSISIQSVTYFGEIDFDSIDLLRHYSASCHLFNSQATIQRYNVDNTSDIFISHQDGFRQKSNICLTERNTEGSNELGLPAG